VFIDFAHLKRQLSLAAVLEHLGLAARLRGSGAQRRCACPLHRGDARGRTFRVNLEENVFCCFDKRCGKHGDVIDLWAELHHVSLREAAIDLVATFGLEPAAKSGTEKRDG
jgi:DNA primase